MVQVSSEGFPQVRETPAGDGMDLEHKAILRLREAARLSEFHTVSGRFFLKACFQPERAKRI